MANEDEILYPGETRNRAGEKQGWPDNSIENGVRTEVIPGPEDPPEGSVPDKGELPRPEGYVPDEPEAWEAKKVEEPEHYAALQDAMAEGGSETGAQDALGADQEPEEAEGGDEAEGESQDEADKPKRRRGRPSKA